MVERHYSPYFGSAVDAVQTWLTLIVVVQLQEKVKGFGDD